MRSLAAVLVLAAGTAYAASGPAFDCRKAATPVEKTICAQPELEALDRRLAAAFRDVQASLPTPDQKNAVRADQVAWLKERDRCDADRVCLHASYEHRLDLMEGRSAQWPLAGQFEVARTGTLTLFPLPGHYLLSMQTADPVDGHWTCEFEGDATPVAGGALHVQSRDGSVHFEISSPSRETIRIPDNPDVGAALSGFCGAGGSLQFAFQRAAPR